MPNRSQRVITTPTVTGPDKDGIDACTAGFNFTLKNDSSFDSSIVPVTWGGQYQALRAITFTGAKVHTLATSGTLTAKLWSGGSVVASGSATITAAGTYTITFTVPYDAAGGEVVTLGARDETTLTYFSDPNIMTMPQIAGPALRIIAQSLRNSGDLEPALGGGQSHVYAVTPILSAS